MAFDGAGQLAGEAAGIVLIVQRDIIHLPTRCAQFGGEMAHGREDQRDFLLVMPDVSRFLADFHHQDDGIIGRLPLEAGDRAGELVAKDRYENGAALVSHDLALRGPANRGKLA